MDNIEKSKEGLRQVFWTLLILYVLGFVIFYFTPLGEILNIGQNLIFAIVNFVLLFIAEVGTYNYKKYGMYAFYTWALFFIIQVLLAKNFSGIIFPLVFVYYIYKNREGYD